MTKHVTLTLDDELKGRIREHQAQMMLEGNRTCSFSDAVNDILARGV